MGRNRSPRHTSSKTGKRGLPRRAAPSSTQRTGATGQNPLEHFVGEERELQIVRLNDDGDGVGRLEDVTVFVRGALPGESVLARVTNAHRRHLSAELLHVESSTALQVQDNNNTTVQRMRTLPLCPVSDTCGGCQLQHISYQAQLDHKQQVVAGALKRIGKFADALVLPTIGMDDPWRYRNQIQMPVDYDEASGELRQGFFAVGSHQIIETSECLLVPESVERTMEELPKQIVQHLGAEARFVHHLIIRHSRHTGEQMVILCVRRHFSGLEALARTLLCDPVVSVAVTVQEHPTGPVWGHVVEVLAGKDAIKEELDGVEFLISPRSFFQVNTVQAEVLTTLAKERCNLTGDEVILDAYCGTGTFSLTLARYAKETVGVEAISAAIEDAKQNAEINAVGNATFVVGNVEEVLPKWVGEGRSFDVAVLDPPRKGCHPDVLQALVNAGIPRIVYVSCNPATLARDARILEDTGYRFGPFQPVDMFPHTSHVECVVAAHYVGKE